MKKKYSFILFLVFSISCSSDSTEPTVIETSEAIYFENLIFDTENAFFSTNGSMEKPVGEEEAKLKVNNIDITFIYNTNYHAPGFFDPVARSAEYYWDDHYLPWLVDGIETRYYWSKLTKEDFEAAIEDASKIDEYFQDTESMFFKIQRACFWSLIIFFLKVVV